MQFGVRRLDAAFTSIVPGRDQSGVKLPHSKTASCSCILLLNEKVFASDGSGRDRGLIVLFGG